MVSTLLRNLGGVSAVKKVQAFSISHDPVPCRSRSHLWNLFLFPVPDLGPKQYQIFATRWSMLWWALLATEDRPVTSTAGFIYLIRYCTASLSSDQASGTTLVKTPKIFLSRDF